MNKLLAKVLILVILPPWAYASKESEFYDSIRTLDTLFEVIDDKATEYRFIDRGMEFTHYYSNELNRSFIVNDEIGEVCFTYEGSKVLSCFPCKGDGNTESCP